MKITVEHMDLPENEVILRCPALDEEMLGVLSLLRSGLQRLCVWDDSRRTTLLTPDEVVYCETVDDRIFVYTGQAMYQTALGLGELESRYSGLGFFRAGKSAVVNLHHIRSLVSQGAGTVRKEPLWNNSTDFISGASIPNTAWVCTLPPPSPLKGWSMPCSGSGR